METTVAAWLPIIGTAIAIIASGFAVYRGWREEQRRDIKEDATLLQVIQEAQKETLKQVRAEHESCRAELSRLRNDCDELRRLVDDLGGV